MPKTQTHLGTFLLSERIRRGEENISDYIKEHNVAISESYYRDLENGRKTPHIGKAEKICLDLRLDTNEFFYHLLKDVVPEKTFESLIKPSQKHIFKTASDEIERLTENLEQLRCAYKKDLLEEPFEVDDKIVDYLSRKSEILPVIHFVYMRSECSFQEISRVMAQNNISMPIEEVVLDFEKYKLAVVDRKNEVLKRHKRIFRIPQSKKGARFKDNFFLHETQQSIKRVNRAEIFNNENTYIYSAISCFNVNKSKPAVEKRITDLIATFSAEEDDLKKDAVTPFYVSVVVSSREDYDFKL